ncbi:MAG: FAD-dependent monooxygenase [Pseudomonadota bacterium]
MLKSIDADVIIVGAGLVGLAAAIAFTAQKKNVVLVSNYKPVMHQQQDGKNWDERVYALTPATENWLSDLGVWQHINQARVGAIDAMQVWGADAELLLKAEDAHLAKLGLIIENQNLINALWQKIHALDVTVITDAECLEMDCTLTNVQLSLENKVSKDQLQINAKLLVAADGIYSWIRQKLSIGIEHKNYHQTAIVANFLAEKPHREIARQWFNPHNTLALLPLPNQHVSMVWSLSTQQAAELLLLSADALSDQVQAQSENCLGELKLVGQIKSIELHQQTATKLIGERVVFVGDSAHQIHPMAGQGVNLGFRDVMKLAELTTKLHAMHDIGDTGFLRQYERARKADVMAMNYLTSGLDYLFASEQSLLKKLTQFGLRHINKQASTKKRLIMRAVS